MSRLLFTATLLGSLTVLGTTQTLQAGHRDCEYGYQIGPFTAQSNSHQSSSGHDVRYGYRYYRPVVRSNPYFRYRYGNPPYGFGNFYRDRQGFFFYGRDDRYRFGIHR